MDQQKSWKKKSIVLGIIAAIIFGIFYYISGDGHPIYDFDETRDMQEILQIFDDDWYWLIESEDYSPEFMLTHRAPNKDPMYVGSLHIKVLREKNKLAGFAAYYLKKKGLYQLLFLAVNKNFRGKGYGEQLLCYALKDAKKLGANQVRLVTRSTNFPAQRLYKRVGFKQVDVREDGKFIYFEYGLDSL
ncbi:MAG: GNAT family N-acetyltransferase [Candidatus Babeliales bacterium]|jgi:ribosomal protein S18 acetylase RimI-like enzyme